MFIPYFRIFHRMRRNIYNLTLNEYDPRCIVDKMSTSQSALSGQPMDASVGPDLPRPRAPNRRLFPRETPRNSNAQAFRRRETFSASRQRTAREFTTGRRTYPLNRNRTLQLKRGAEDTAKPTIVSTITEP